MKKFTVTIVYHRAYEKTKIIEAETLEEAEHLAIDCAANIEARLNAVYAEVDSIIEH